uniref:5-formyltetrahydrofolate cyclo-ligase n=1 Tax=Aureoumbra lagunensis TaxID=44058 RepID=A0A7S3K4D6_9STRA
MPLRCSTQRLLLLITILIILQMNDASVKKELRSRVRSALRAMTNEYIFEQSNLACERLFISKEYQNARGIACFASMEKEFQTQLLLDRIMHDDKKLFLPKCITKRDMTLFEIPKNTSISELPKNQWNIPEPQVGNNALEDDHLDLVLVPGLAFSMKTRARLGQGAGYYDTWLSTLQKVRISRNLPMPLTIGLCLDEQLFHENDEIPLQPHDFLIHHLVAPSFSSLSSSFSS